MCEYFLFHQIQKKNQEIVTRLKKRKYSRKKVYDNVLSEILDYCLIVSEKKYDNVIQINCTGKTPEKIVKEILKEKNSKTPNWLVNTEESYLKQYN